MTGVQTCALPICSRFELNELGASAGINTMMERYRYDLGGTAAGSENSPMHIKPEWRGPSLPSKSVKIVSIQGCDQAPVDLSDPEAALRVKSYVWPENAGRLERMDAAIALAAQKRPDVVHADALDWVLERLTVPQDAGIVRVINHSIVWQYIPGDRRTLISEAIEAKGQEATAERPLVWMMLETNRETFKHELSIKYWPGPDKWHLSCPQVA